MKLKIIILFTAIFIINCTVFSQINFKKLSLVTAAKLTTVHIASDTIYVSSIEVGIGKKGGREYTPVLGESRIFGFYLGTTKNYRNWAYFSPYATMSYNSAFNSTQEKSIKLKGGNSPFLLNTGVSAGAGHSLFLILPIGICGSAGLSSDFKDIYLSYSLGLCAYNLSVSVGSMTNITNRHTSFYKTQKSYELKYIWRLFKNDYLYESLFDF